MTLKNLLAAGLALSLACTAAFADWVPTGFTTIAQFPDKVGKNARTLVIEAQLAREEVWVQKGKPTRNKRWMPLSNATILFQMHPSTGVERRWAVTAADGWARAKWEVPRYNRYTKISMYAKFQGGVINSVKYRPSQTRKATIYVTR